MLQNRVDPFGDIIRTPARGAWMGNRGLIHNNKKEMVRPYKLIPWITCVLEFKGWHREVMTPNRYTELFFMDEATAFSAGHRPCSECRRSDYQRFKDFWIKGNPEYGFTMKTLIGKIDAIIHAERIAADKSKVTYEENLNKLPDGAFVLYEHKPYLIKRGKIYLWTPFGYEKSLDLPQTDKLPVLTPRSVINTFSAGYVPQMAV
ncbi:hypothetical protein [Mucilaginibacter sp. SP1R1]|uniref:hypothetical protein n=1 Tax=Mucilaginibacter sp. SP1R1 TaxID=2723091 RepID=UPI001610F286|nr:hypothetical protein [Mucilaginibacter sp. SP1R1]MBB6148561.1 hypothetical protein [Mucilaginibacter sp. SP1R1]